MSGEALYERYKDALRRGHVASLRGKLDEALEAYAEAAALAPDRSTPHTSAGTAFLRARRPADALHQFDAALRNSPRDEVALTGRAQALAALGRRPEAAEAFDVLADLEAGAGKPAEAVDAARRGLELAEARHRRRTLERLIERLRASEPDEPGRLALERALRVLEGAAVPGQPADRPAPSAPAPATPASGETPSALEPAAQAAPAAPADAALPDLEPAGTAEAAEARGVPGAPGAPAEPGPGAEPAAGVLDRVLPPDAGVEELVLRAQAAVDAGDPEVSERFLDLAAASRRSGRLDTALDACYQALTLHPDDVGLHLALVQLYDEQGWVTLADEKLGLLERLATLAEDAEVEARLAAARAARP